MAVIGKIREKSTLLIVFVGISLLLFIIPFDKVSNYFYGSGEQPIGSMDGEPILDSEWNYSRAVEFETQNARNNYYNQTGKPLVLTEQEVEQQKNQVWSRMILEKLYGKQLAEVPVAVGNKELNEVILYGDQLPEYIQKQFTYNGVYSQDSLKKYINNMLVQGKSGKAFLYSNIEQPLKIERQRSKYSKMAKYGVYATNQDAKRKFIEKNTKASVRYAYKEFSTIPDSLIKVEDADIKAYFDAHKNEKKWDQETEMRTIDFVTFKVSPSQEDKEQALAEMERKKLSFAKTSNDSLYVANNAATPIGANQQRQGQFQLNTTDVLPTEPYKPGSGTFSVAADEQITAAKKGEVVGPIVEGNKIQLIKVRDVVTKNEVTVRHILVSAKEGDADFAKKKTFADSLLRVLKADRSKFVDFVYKYSEDPGSNTPGKDGEYTFDKDINFVQEYKDFGFNKPVGALEIVKTSFGFHIMENLKRGDNEYKMIAVVDAKVKPSKVTKDIAYTEVVDGFHKQAKAVGFEKAAEEVNKEVKTAENVRVESPFIGELGKNMSLVKWNFNHKVGSISDPEFVGDELLAVTCLKSESHEGSPTFEGVKALMKPYVIKEKKAEYLLTKIGSSTSVDDVAKAMEVTAETGELDLSMNNLPGIASGVEPEVVGTIFATEAGTTTKPIKGDNGLYVVEVTSKTAATIAENPDYSVEKGTLLGEMRANIESQLIEAIAKAADFKDWRMKQQIIKNN